MASTAERNCTLIGTGLVALSLCWMLVAQGALAGDAQGFVRPGSAAARLSACVEPTAYMRRNHMELIQHQRDTTVHQGIRGTRYSLAGCIDCHVSYGPDGHPVAVNEKRQFCNACHAFAAVTVNCFDCHAGIPRGGPLSEAAVSLAQRAIPGATHGIGRTALRAGVGGGSVTRDPRGSGQE